MNRATLVLAQSALIAAAVAASASPPPAEGPKSPPLLPPPTHLPSSPLPAPTPELDAALGKLRAERAALDKMRRQFPPDRSVPSGDAAARLKLRLKVAELLGKLKDKGRPGAPLNGGLPPGVPRPDPLERSPGAIGDRLTLAQLQFRSREYAAALKTLEAMDRGELISRDRTWADYLRASCLRHLGKLGDAAKIYREVADTKEDKVLSEAATWQLGFLRWRQEMTTKLDALSKK